LATPAVVPGKSVVNGLDKQTTLTAGLEGKGLSGAVSNQSSLEFPIIIAQWDRNRREVIRVALDKYNGRHTINARVWYHDGATLKPGKSGMTLAVTHLPAFAEAMGKALDAARELGLIEDQGGER
jgi:Transcriptional Coactivator p15 (PC4)